MRTGERLRRVAKGLVDEALAAVAPGPLVREHLERRPLPGEGPVVVVAVGKAADSMARAALEVLDRRVVGGVVLHPPGRSPAAMGPLEVFQGGHPIPTVESVEGSRAILRCVQGLGPGDQLLCLVSGGGSALMTLPAAGLALEDLQVTTEVLLRAGAEIGELNAVRKHLEQLKGGRLAQSAAPASMRGLVLSDVIGDPLDVIASGPLSPDPTTWTDAADVVRRLEVADGLPTAVRDVLEQGVGGEIAETPKAGSACFETVDLEIIGNNRRAVAALRRKAGSLGYRTLCLTTSLAGEAREVGRVLGTVAREIREHGEPLEAPACLVVAGETTVTVCGAGRGGRNQEVALGAAEEIAGLPGVLVASFGTDGIDGPTDAAGAWVSGDTASRAMVAGLDGAAALGDNDAYPFFAALGDLIMLGPTGTNVMDVAFVLVDSSSS